MTTDPRAVGRAQVAKGEALAGSLSRVSGSDDVLFDYDPAYLGSGMPPVATTLPRSVRGQRSRGGAVPPFSAGARATHRMLAELSDRLSPLTEGVAAIGFDERRTTHLITVMRQRLADLTQLG